MYEHYQTPIPQNVLKAARKDLRNIYNDVPETEGCMESLPSCGAWCCQHQSPSLFYSEFLNTYWAINHQWSKKQLSDLFIRAVRSYIAGKATKGCIFWDRDSKKCMQHETRPFNCRTYGQVPEEDFRPRFERLKVLYAERPDAFLKEQCGLVKTVGTPPTSRQMNDWFEEIKLVEQDIGITRGLMHDGDGGTYRTYQDHILLQMAPPTLLSQLSHVRETASLEEKEAFVAKMEADIAAELNDVKRK
jgi:Fe-S-cluster containining protein